MKFSNDISITIFQSVAKWYMYRLHFFLFNFLPSPRIAFPTGLFAQTRIFASQSHFSLGSSSKSAPPGLPSAQEEVTAGKAPGRGSSRCLSRVQPPGSSLNCPFRASVKGIGGWRLVPSAALFAMTQATRSCSETGEDPHGAQWRCSADLEPLSTYVIRYIFTVILKNILNHTLKFYF